MESTEQQRSELSSVLPPVPPRNAHIYCPKCDYDLTGAPTNRCPECGREYDQEKLARWVLDHDQPLPAGGFLGLMWMSVFGARRLGREMPRLPRVDKAGEYAFHVRMLVLLLLLLGQPMGLLLGLVVAFSSYACELALSETFRVMVRGRAAYGAMELPFAFWRAMTACVSTYLLFSCVAYLATPAIRSVVPALSGRFEWFPVLAVGCWWWYSLGRAVVACSEATKGRVIAITLIPAVGVGAVGAAYGVGWLIAMVCHGVLG